MDNRAITASSHNCCGCGACKAVCPVNAIKMSEDEYGFISPVIDHRLCINCGKCKKVCAFAQPERSINEKLPIRAYAAALHDNAILSRSASGGAFAGIAQYVLSNGGLVYGAAFSEDHSVEHIEISSVDDLHLIQGSKYTQSNTAEIWNKVKERLESGRTVLFSGTPCQVASLKTFLGKDYADLYTIDLICHGVGSNRMFQDDLKYLSRRYSSPIKLVSFRSKRRGWGTDGDLVLEKKTIDYSPINSPYYYFFLDSSIFRESCYHCPFATQKRAGDLTIGDFWGIESAVPDRRFDTEKGVSCLIVNTSKGQDMIERVSGDYELITVDYARIVKRNWNLHSHSIAPARRQVLLSDYITLGYKGIVDHYNKKTLRKRMSLKAKRCIPRRVKGIIKRFLR